MDEDSSEAPSSDDSDSSGTLCAIQTLKRQKEAYNVSRECQRLQDEFLAAAKQLYKPIHPSKQMRQNPNQQFEGSEDYDYVVDRKTGWKWYKEQQGNLPHTSSSSSFLIMAEFLMAKIESHGGGIPQSLTKGSE